MSTDSTDSTWLEMQRLRDLAKERGKDTDPLQIAVEELGRYKRAIREVRLERDWFRAELYRLYGTAS